MMFFDEGNTVILSAGGMFEISLGGHQYGKERVTTAPTCQTAGVGERICAVCGDTEVYQIPVAENAHNRIWTNLTEPTCRRDGINVLTCTVCRQEFEKQTVQASEKYHIAGDWEVTKVPTESESGTERQLCRECGKTMNSRTIGKLPQTGNNPPGNDPSGNNGRPLLDSGVPAIAMGIILLIAITATCIVVISKKKKAGK